MCRSIKQLRRPERDVSEAEIEAAARQFVHKVSGYRVLGRATLAPPILAGYTAPSGANA